jgi:hypothetical protein
MRKPDAFLICHVMIVAVLAVLYFLSERHFAKYDADLAFQQKVQQRQRFLLLTGDLQNVQKAEKKQPSERGPAALMPFDQQNLQWGAELQKQAEILYTDAQKYCYEFNGELSCLEVIEKVVTHFPETVWAGKSLLILGDFYHRTKRFEQARDIVSILKSEFGKKPELRKKTALLERALQ